MVLSCPVLSSPALFYSVLSCPVLSCPVLSCPVLSCPHLPDTCSEVNTAGDTAMKIQNKVMIHAAAAGFIFLESKKYQSGRMISNGLYNPL
jgi:hypothetical protein